MQLVEGAVIVACHICAAGRGQAQDCMGLVGLKEPAHAEQVWVLTSVDAPVCRDCERERSARHIMSQAWPHIQRAVAGAETPSAVGARGDKQ